jgi:hypothetical protein
MSSTSTDTDTISEVERLALHRQVEQAFDRIPEAAYESARRAGVCWGVLPGCRASKPSTIAAFRGSGSSWGNDDPWIVFFGPMLVTASQSAIQSVALHEWSHAYLWAVGDLWWKDEWAADVLAVKWGADEALLLKVRGLL